jgi:hypothetical protein
MSTSAAIRGRTAKSPKGSVQPLAMVREEFSRHRKSCGSRERFWTAEGLPSWRRLRFAKRVGLIDARDGAPKKRGPYKKRAA